jgi:hypothetical protein
VKTGNSDRVREYAGREYIGPARQRGDITVRIVAGDVHNALKLHNRVPQVCDALGSGKFLEENELALLNKDGPKMSTTTTFTYRLLNGSKQRPKPEADRFLRMYGIGKEVFESLGGGEAFIRSERENFYGDKKEHP